jgi:hypothetical protein
MKTTLNVDLKTILIIVVILIFLFGGGFGWMSRKFNQTNDQLAQQLNLTEALRDSLHLTKNALNEEVASKRTLQVSINKLTDMNGDLTDNQKELLDRIGGLEKGNKLISAALVRSEVKIDSLLFAKLKVVVNTKDTTITLSNEPNDSINFNVTISKVLPTKPYQEPTLKFNSLEIPDKSLITFEFKDDKKYYQKPVGFTISHSSPYIKVTDVDSYIIPEVNDKLLYPSTRDKFGAFFNKPAVKWIGGAVILTGGIYIGATAF